MDFCSYQAWWQVKKDKTSAPSKFFGVDNRKNSKPADTQFGISTLGNQPSNEGQKRNQYNCYSPCSNYKDSRTPAACVNDVVFA